MPTCKIGCALSMIIMIHIAFKNMLSLREWFVFDMVYGIE